MSADGSVSPWSVPRQLRKGWTLGRAVQAPTHWPIVSHPTNPLVLRWSAVPHTAKYLVTIASDFTRAHSFTLQRTTGAGGIRVSQRLRIFVKGRLGPRRMSRFQATKRNYLVGTAHVRVR